MDGVRTGQETPDHTMQPFPWHRLTSRGLVWLQKMRHLETNDQTKTIPKSESGRNESVIFANEDVKYYNIGH